MILVCFFTLYVACILLTHWVNCPFTQNNALLWIHFAWAKLIIILSWVYSQMSNVYLEHWVEFTVVWVIALKRE